MTREEAIKGLTSLVEVRRKYFDMQTMKDEIECLDIAIKALEHPEKNVVAVIPCGDAISRQAVIDAMFGLCDDGENPHIDAITDTIERIPSVTPQPKIGYWEWMPYTHNPNTELLGDWCCSECKSVVVECVSAGCGIPLYKYCPQCGAEMQEVEK